MKIIIDARMINDTGIGRYVRNLVLGLEKAHSDHEFVVLLRHKDWDSYQPATDNFSKVLVDFKFYGWQEQLLLPFKLWKLKPDLVHFPHLNVPVAYRGRNVVTIHDLTLMDYKNVRGGIIKKPLYEAKYWIMRLVLANAIRQACAVITDSAFVCGQIAKRFNVSLSKLTAIHLAVSPLRAGVKSVPGVTTNDQYLLYVGNYYPHKNIGRLIKAMADVIKEHPAAKLVLAGKSDYFQQQLQQQATRLGLINNVLFTGFVSDEQLNWLYQHATGYVFPSLSEGFGLPGLEAMSEGVPVLAAGASCLPEIYEGAAEYFDPTSAADIARSITHLLNDKGMQKRLSSAGKEQIKKFSWEKMTAETLEVYEQLLR